MKKLLSVVLAVATATLPSVSAAVEVEGPQIERGAGTPAPVVPAVDLNLGAADLGIHDVDLSVKTPAAAENLAAPQTLVPAQKAEAAATAQAVSAQAQATAALPTANETKDTARMQRRSNQVFAGQRAAGGGETEIPGDVESYAASADASSNPSGPTLGAATGRGPPTRREPPPGDGNGGRKGPSKKVLAAVALVVVAAILAFTPAPAAAIGTLAGQAHVVAVVFGKYGPFFGVVSALSALGYDFSNVVGFLYPLAQVHELFRDRSGDVSRAQQITGIGASLLLAFNMFMLNGPGHSTLFSAYQNLWGGLAFALILGQALYYTRRPGKEGDNPGALKVFLQTGVAIVALAAATAALGVVLTHGIPLLHAQFLKVPFQMILGFGFAYLTLPGYLKIEREKKVGAASFGVPAMFLAANLALVIWSMFSLATLPGMAVGATFGSLAVFAAIAAAGSYAAFRWLVARKWKFIPESVTIFGKTIHKVALIDLTAFAAVSVFMTALVACGFFVLNRTLGVPQAQVRDFLTFLFYLVDVILASTSSWLTVRAFQKYRKNEPGGSS